MKSESRVKWGIIFCKCIICSAAIYENYTLGMAISVLFFSEHMNNQRILSILSNHKEGIESVASNIEILKDCSESHLKSMTLLKDRIIKIETEKTGTDLNIE